MLQNTTESFNYERAAVRLWAPLGRGQWVVAVGYSLSGRGAVFRAASRSCADRPPILDRHSEPSEAGLAEGPLTCFLLTHEWGSEHPRYHVQRLKTEHAYHL